MFLEYNFLKNHSSDDFLNVWLLPGNWVLIGWLEIKESRFIRFVVSVLNPNSQSNDPLNISTFEYNLFIQWELK